MPNLKHFGLITFLLVSLAFGPGQAGHELKVVATTTIVGDVVRNIGGEAIALTVLLPPGADPHSYEPVPQDLVALAQADLIFINGVGLEARLEPFLREARAPVISVSGGLTLRRLEEEGGFDPHVWFDPQNVLVWAENIEKALTAADPANAGGYASNAQAYKLALQGLDAWILEQVAQIPQENRKLVTDHLFLGYFADRYGFEQVGAIFPGFSTLAEPSARELAELEEAILRSGVKAIFVGTTVNPALAERLAADTGVKIVFLYTGSLSEPGGQADTYLKLMEYDVSAIVQALK
ncbi:MAG: metal ABC transporter solute-binding protein, Zn/Mn family [Candidatus Bipolaricaulia bacterium]